MSDTMIAIDACGQRGPDEAAQRGHETVLLVDDEPAVLSMGKQMLENLGYQVLSASLSGEALALAEQHAGKIHLLLTDVAMPDMNGLTLTSRVALFCPGIKYLFMSAYTSSVLVREQVLGEDVHFIQKPFSIRALANKLREVLDSGRQRHSDGTTGDELSEIGTAAGGDGAEGAPVGPGEFGGRTEIPMAEQALRLSADDPYAWAARLQAVREEERAKLSRELHDTLGQQLTAFAMQYELVCMDCRVLAGGPPEFVALHAKITGMAPRFERLITQTQAMCAALRPCLLDALGLVAAIESLVENTAKRNGMVCTMSLPADDPGLDRDIQVALYRIVEAVLTNAALHAQAAHVEVSLRPVGSEWELELRVNSLELPPQPFLGMDAPRLLDIRTRIGAVGGSVEFTSAPGKGSTMRVRIAGDTEKKESRVSV